MLKACVWDREDEMESTIQSAKNIIAKVKWTGEPYICIFVGGSTIHIGVVDKSGKRIEGSVWCDAKNPDKTITEHLQRMETSYRSIATKTQVRVLLAGSPTKVTTKYTDHPEIHFFHNGTEKTQTMTKAGMEYIAKLAENQEDNGGLSRVVGGKNPGKAILDYIFNAMGDDWIIACGNRDKTDYYCTDNPYKLEHLPKGANKDYNYVIVSSGDITLMKKKNAEDKKPLTSRDDDKYTDLLARLTAENAFTKNTVLLVTAGFTVDERKAQTKIAAKWIKRNGGSWRPDTMAPGDLTDHRLTDAPNEVWRSDTMAPGELTHRMFGGASYTDAPKEARRPDTMAPGDLTHHMFGGTTLNATFVDRCLT